LKEKQVQFGPVEVSSPQVKFSRDIFVAYDSGLLVKTIRTLTVEGRTTSPVGAPPPPPAGGGFQGGPGFGGGAPGFAPGGAPGFAPGGAAFGPTSGAPGFPGQSGFGSS